MYFCDLPFLQHRYESFLRTVIIRVIENMLLSIILVLVGW